MPFKKTNFSWIYNIEIYNRLEESLFAIIKINNNTSLTFKDLYESKYFFSRKIIAKSFQYMKYLCGWSKRKPVLFGVEAEIFIESNFSSRIFTIPAHGEIDSPRVFTTSSMRTKEFLISVGWDMFLLSFRAFK